MAGSLLRNRVFGKTLNWVLAGLVLPFLLFGVGTLEVSYAAAPNFKVQIENSLSTSANTIFVYNQNTKNKQNLTFDSSGNISEFLSDGEYTAVLFPNLDESNSRTSSNYRFTINSGLISAFVKVSNHLNEKPIEESVAQNSSGFYQLYLGTTGFKLGMTVGSDTKTVVIKTIFAANKYSKPINPTYLNDGKVVVDIDPGTYTVYGSDVNGIDSGSTTCVVSSGTVSTCSITLTAPNFLYRIVGSSGETLTSTSEIQFNLEKLDSKEGVESSQWISSSDIGSQSLQNGLYNLKIYKSYLDSKIGQSSNFRITVALDAISEVKSTDTGETSTATSGRFQIKLRSENLKFKVTAGGSPLTNFYMSAWNEKSSRYSWAYPDSSGNVSTSLTEGISRLYLYPSGSSTEYVGVSAKVTVASGVITEFVLSTGESLSKSGDFYNVPLLVANVQGILTVGGVGKSGYVSGAFDTTLNKYVNTNATSINSDGKFGIALPKGSYLIQLAPFSFDSQGRQTQDSLHLYVKCEVPETLSVTCSYAAPATNFELDIFSITDTRIATSASTEVSYLSASSSFRETRNIRALTGDSLKFSLQDGKYVFTVKSERPTVDGQNRRYAVFVANGSVTKVVDEKTDATVNDVGGVYRLRLGSPNLSAILKANGQPNPRAGVYAFQEGFESLYSAADTDGRIGFDLPDGRNTVVINTTGNETPTVVSARFTVIVESSTVMSVANMSGDTLTATSGVYTFDYQVPNIVGKMTINNQPSSGYIQGVWNTVLNKPTTFDGSTISQTGDYSILVAAGNYDVMFVPNGGVGGVQNCNATANVRTTCDINFPANNLELKVKDSSGTVLTSRVSAVVTRQFTKGQSFPGQSYSYGLSIGAGGQFVGSLVDGSYQLEIRSNSPFTDGDGRQFSFKVESGTVSTFKDLDTLAEIDTATASAGLPLVSPNFKAIINANSLPANGTFGNLYSLSNKGDFYKHFRVDTEGKISFKISDGDYRMFLYPSGSESPLVVRTYVDIKVTAGEVISVKYRDGTGAANSLSIYTINLATPNLMGTYSYGGENPSGQEIYFSSVFNEGTQRFVDFDFASNNAGNYGIRIDDGTYLFSLYKYGKSGTLHRCAVSGSSNSCNFDVPKDNFTFKIQSSTGEELLEDVGASSRISLDANAQKGGWGFWNRPGVGGLFKSGLKLPSDVAGSYEFSVYTTDGSNRRGIARTYRVSVTGESVTAVTDVLTGAAVNPGSDGVYAFRLTAPNLAGTVVAPDGSTPIPNSGVQAEGPSWNSFNTDNSGAFAGYLEEDGSYSVWARAPEFDITKADSAMSTVTVANGTGNSSLSLQLRTPNVSGVVSGPTGVSSYNYIQVLKKNEYGNFEYFGYNVRPRSSNTQGKFAFYLEPGDYKFQAEADEENAGGGRTISSECLVLDTSTPMECNITLLSSNVKIKVLGEGDRIYTQGYIYLHYEGSKYDTSWPEKSWDHSNINQQGLSRLSVGNGTWRGRIELYGSGNESPLDFSVKIETGTVQSVTSSTGETFTANAEGFYELKLPISNLRGEILDAGVKFSGGTSISVWQTDAEEGFYANRWSNNGEFAFKVNPGSYTIEVHPYSWGQETLNAPVRTRIINCEVPETGVKTCDVALKSPNFKAKVTFPAGQIATDSYAHILKMTTTEDGNQFFGWHEGTRVQAGLFSSFLETGTYQIHVYPGWESRGNYSSNKFEVIVSAGSVQSVKNLLNNATLTASSGIFSLPLVTPAIAGKVLKSGSSTTVVKWAQILVLDINTAEELWDYSTNTNSLGNFALTVPDGTYDLVAKVWGGKGGEDSGFSSSAKYRVTVSGGVGDTNTVIRMRDPNFSLRVVSPTSASTGLSNMWIHGNFNDQYFGGMTDQSGYFTAYIDTSTTTNCTSTCRINIYPATQKDYTPNSVSFASVTNIGDISPGVVNSTVYVYIPTNGGTGIPNKWSWISVEELDSSGTTISEAGYGTNELGRVGVGLTSGSKYRITAHPSGEFYGRYSPKSTVIDSFSTDSHSTISITFASPNITFIVTDNSEKPNSWGWYEVFTVDSPTVTKFVDGYLNDQGRGAQYLPDGSYKVTFYPGGSKGVEKTISFNVSGLHVETGTGVTFVNDVGTVVLGSGNITGVVRNSSGTALSNVPVTAASTTGTAAKVTTVTKSDGTYELNLSTSQSWTVQAIDPITLKTGSTSVVENSGSYTGKDISLAHD